MRDVPPWAIWDQDRMHLNAIGHQHIALAVLDRLGVSHALGPPELPERQMLNRGETRRANVTWAREHALPWVQRRLTGRSSGDLVTARRPTLAPIE
jgi:hypothetical protein